MAKIGPVIDAHATDNVALKSALRDSVAANAGEKTKLRTASPQRPAIRANVAMLFLVKYFFIEVIPAPENPGADCDNGFRRRQAASGNLPNTGVRAAPPVQELNPARYRN
jgi:hypothetical protein